MISRRFFRKRSPAFTLAELLIALAILGVIATFTIPKILQSQQDGRSKAIAKEAAATVSAAYSAYKLNNGPGANTGPDDLTPYLNYVAADTASSVDDVYGGGSMVQSCTGATCFRLHNGGVLRLPDNRWGGPGTGNYFGGTATTNYIYFYFDPDGVVTSPSTTNGPGKSVIFTLYFNGKISDMGSCRDGDTTWLDGTGYNNWCPGATPTWFNWS